MSGVEEASTEVEMCTSFLELPVELRQKVLHRLEMHDLYTLKRVHPMLDAVVEDYLEKNLPRTLNLLRFLLGLHRSGLLEGNELTIDGELLLWIRRHCAAIEALQVSRPIFEAPSSRAQYFSLYNWVYSFTVG